VTELVLSPLPAAELVIEGDAPVVLEVGPPPDLELVTIAEQGPAGPGSGEVYNHTQSSPDTLWTINHNLGRRPVVELRTVGGVVMVGNITHVSTNQVQVSFATAIAGTALLA
jgi:hypothetical protein